MRSAYAAAVHDALRLMGGDTSRISAVRQDLQHEQPPKIATEVHNFTQAALHELLPHMTSAHISALKAKGHAHAIDEAIRDMSPAQLKRSHKAHLGPVERGMVRRDMEVALRQHVRALPSEAGVRRRPESFTPEAEEKAQGHLVRAITTVKRDRERRGLSTSASTPEAAAAPTSGHQWEPVKGKPNRRKRKLPSGKWHYEDVPMQKAGESLGDYMSRLLRRIQRLAR